MEEAPFAFARLISPASLKTGIWFGFGLFLISSNCPTVRITGIDVDVDIDTDTETDTEDHHHHLIHPHRNTHTPIQLYNVYT